MDLYITFMIDSILNSDIWLYKGVCRMLIEKFKIEK